MSSTTFDGDRIGPELDLADVTLPPHVGHHLATLYGREERIETAAEWVTAMRAASERTTGGTPTPDDLCYFEDGNHSVDVDGETHSFVCVLDPLVVPFLRETPATVRSTTPEDGASVEIAIGLDGVAVDAPDAVVSLGVVRDPQVDGPPTHEDVYTETCPYIHVFASADEYERWADGVDAATTSVPVETGVAVARELATELFA